MTTHEFIQRDPNVGKIGLYRVFRGNIVACIATAAPGITTELINSEVDHVLHQVEGDSYHAILDVRNLMWSSRDARNWMNTDKSKAVTLSYALIATNPITALLARMSLRFNNLKIPYAFFGKFDEALTWTDECKQNRISTSDKSIEEVAKRA